MATIGVDCDITISHPSVNSGAAVGFVLERDTKQGGRVMVEREAYLTATGQWAEREKYTFKVLIGDAVGVPYKGKQTYSRQEAYDLLRSLLLARTNLELVTERGTFADCHASLKYAVEQLRTADFDLIEVTLNNGGYPEFVPIDFAALNASFYDSGVTYDQAYFR